jgi:hypothetical protein
VLVFGCAVNRPALDFSASAVFAGCGVLKPVNILGLLVSGAFEATGSTDLSEATLVSLFCSAPRKLNPGLLFVIVDGLANEANKFGLGVSEDALAVGSGALTLLNNEGLGVPAASVGNLIAPKELFVAAGVFSCAGCPKVNGVEGSVGFGSEPKGLLAGADEGVPAVANMFGAGAVDVVPAAPNIFDTGAADVVTFDGAPKPNRFDAGAVAVAVAFCVPCALEAVPNMLVFGVSCCAPFCALLPNPPKLLFCAGAALFCEAPKAPNILVGALVPAVCALELAGAPNVKGAAAGAGEPVILAAELVVPNVFVEGAPLVMPKRPPGPDALVVLFCARPPNGLLGACEPNMEPPPKADVPLLLPFIAGALVPPPNMLLLPAALKLKSVAGGCGLKPVFWLFALNAGKDELVKVLLGAAD